MRVLLKEGVLEQLKAEMRMSDQEFSDFIGISRSSLWRAQLSRNDERFSLGHDVIAKILNTFQNKTFEDLFFLEQPSHACDKRASSA